jgi:hypothetical protein
MPGPFHQVALVQVVGAHADAHQVVHQFALDVDIVVHASQQDRLVAQGDAGPVMRSQASASSAVISLG